MQQGFDNRIVSYEHIHSISPEDFEKLIDAIDPQEGEIILDAMCGYGAVGKAVLERNPKVNVFFNDESEVQIQRAIKNLPDVDRSRFIVSALPHDNFQPNCFDKIVVKMGLHEVSLSQHLEILKEFHRILKPNGKVIVWDIMLNDASQKLFQDIIRKKDELAGFNLLTRERYFFREDEFLKNAVDAGFESSKDFHKIKYNFSSKKRLESELDNDTEKLRELNEYIRGRFPEELRGRLEYQDLGDDVRFTIIKKIFILQK